MFRRPLRWIFDPLAQPLGPAATLVPLIARFVFASVLLRFFLNSFLTKISGFGLSIGAYAQILPKQIEAVGYDPSQLSLPLHLVVIAGTLAEPLLPLLIVLGLATRPAALGMMGFLVVMSLTDIYGHGVDAATIGHLFDGDPYGKILDQRLMWAAVLMIPAWLGGGLVSLDALVWRRLRRRVGD
ncbi:MAG: DoxX family membrane protein [Paracoccaceae bacterium]|nr:DoxX family membrane protein [Paracoccaceae bacterium]